MSVLTEGFDSLVEAPGAFAALRTAVRLLAVTGRLLPTCNDEESARTLLQRLCTKAEDPEPANLGGHELPTPWCWARFGDVVEIASNLVQPSNFMDVPHIAPDNIEKGSGRLLAYRTVREDGVTSSNHRFFAGQIVYSKIRPNLSKAVVVDFDGLCSADMYPLNSRIHREYLHLFLLSPVFLQQVVRADNRLAMPKVNQEQLSATLVAVPPLAEQKRIVAKVDELMKLIGDLEAKQTKATATQSRFRISALDALTKAEGPEELAVAWERVSGNFDALLGRGEGAAALRHSIRDLAVTGKLVGKTTAPAAAGPSTGLPSGWVWNSFLDVATIASNLVLPANLPDLPHVAPDNIEKGTGRLLPYRTIREDGVTSNKHRFFAGQILYSKIRPNLSKVVTVDFDGLCSADMYPLTPKIDRYYLHLFLLSQSFLRQVVREDNRLAMPKVNQEQLAATRVAVPPLAEQKRIVAKVETLMKLCDDLEAKLKTKEATASKLIEAVVRELVA